MKKIIILVIILISLGITINAQNRNDFEKAVDYCVCKISYAYTSQYATQNPESDEKKSFEKNVKPKIEKCVIENPIPYSELIKLLKGNNYNIFAEKLSPVIDNVNKLNIDEFTKEEAVNSIINGFYNDESFKNIVKGYDEVNKIKEALKKDLLTLLSSFPLKKSITVEQQSKKDDSTESLKEESTRSRKSIQKDELNRFSINWLSVFLIFISGISLFILFRSKVLYYNERIDEHRRKLNKLKQQIATIPTINKIKNIVETVILESQHIIVLNEIVGKIQIELSELEKRVKALEENINLPQPPPPEGRELPIKKEVLYASIPDNDGSFKSSVVSASEIQGKSYYKFTLLAGYQQKAEFSFINNQRTITDALNSYELILKPVCKFNNALNQNAKRIITDKSGIVTKQGDKWVLDTKAEITYE